MPGHTDVISHSHVGRDRPDSSAHSRCRSAANPRPQVNRAAVGSNRSRTVHLSVTCSNRPGNGRRVVQNVVGRTKHTRCLDTMSSVTVTSTATDPDCIGAVPLPFNRESASAKLRSTAPPLVVIEATVHLSVTRCQCRSNNRCVVDNIVGRAKHTRCMATLMSSVTVTSAATDPDCIGAVPLRSAANPRPRSSGQPRRRW